VGEIDGIRRIRFTSPHPKDIKQDVLEAMAQTPAVCEQLHLPLQSGSARILRAMQRGYTPDRFIEKLRAAESTIPGLATSTDIIVGFPGETEDDFQRTLDVVTDARFDGAYMFIYSPRPGTPAADMDGQVDREVASERFTRLADLQRQVSLEKNQALVGSTVEGLVEGPSRKDPGVVTARTRTNKVLHVPGAHTPGSFLDAVVEHAAPSHLVGRVAT
jgi:tRNA-2-methylthio-N6-dimethylallyladenosine synthase